jgi:putative hydrolase of the HAD superfamily
VKTPAAATALDFTHVDHWVFDLDNTLYPSACNLFAQIDVRITEFVARTLDLPFADARLIQKRLYAEHGTTLSGLMKLHKLQPDGFLDYVHDIDLAPLDLAPDLGATLSGLPGKRYIFTNGSLHHAERVTRKLRIDHLFDDMFDIRASKFLPKHDPLAYEHFLDHTGVDPAGAVMFEDLARNLAPAHARGFTTVLVREGQDWSPEAQLGRPTGPADHGHVHHETADLAGFLGNLRVKPR